MTQRPYQPFELSNNEKRLIKSFSSRPSTSSPFPEVRDGVREIGTLEVGINGYYLPTISPSQTRGVFFAKGPALQALVKTPFLKLTLLKSPLFIKAPPLGKAWYSHMSVFIVQFVLQRPSHPQQCLASSKRRATYWWVQWNHKISTKPSTRICVWVHLPCWIWEICGAYPVPPLFP